MDGTPDLPQGYRRLHLPEIDSTNDEARRRAESGADGGLVVTADRQTAGRGRRGRNWNSPDGNLYCSILVRPEIAPAEGAQAGFAVSLAVADIVADALAHALPVHCKWPNDVLVSDQKVSGILIESASGAGRSVDWLIIGIGINVTSHPDFAEKPATSLAACGVTAQLDDLLAQLVAALDLRLTQWLEQGFDSIRNAWMERAWRLGEQVDLMTGQDQVTGAFRGLDETGGIVLELAGGERRNLGHGELVAQG